MPPFSVKSGRWPPPRVCTVVMVLCLAAPFGLKRCEQYFFPRRLSKPLSAMACSDDERVEGEAVEEEAAHEEEEEADVEGEAEHVEEEEEEEEEEVAEAPVAVAAVGGG